MTGQFVGDHAAALVSLVCAVIGGGACAVAAHHAARGPDGPRRGLIWLTAGLLLLVTFPLIGSAV